MDEVQSGKKDRSCVVKIARAGNVMLSAFAALLILSLFLYGGYSLWDTAMIYRGAFADDWVMQFKPSGNESNPSLEELMTLNPDVRGWITIDDTHIDYPVVQGRDDMEYINKDVEGEFFLPGSIFLSCENAPDFSDSYNLLYGHHMRNGGMFGDVAEFVDQAYFEEHIAGTLYLPDSTHRVELFACVKTDAFDNVVYNPELCHGENMDELLDHIKKCAVQYREIGVTAADRLVGLSTCSETETNGRVILYGKLI